MGATRLHERFVAVARLYRDRPAVSDNSGTLTYGELDRLSGGLAAAIAASVEESRLVGVRVGRHRGAVLAILGALKAGCGYVPVDPDYPAARQALMLEDASVSVVVTDAPDSHERVVGRAAGLSLIRVEAPAPAAVPEDVAYLIYTSGSTGVPKGCVVEHRNVLSLMDAAQPLYGFSHSDSWTLFHSISFDFSVWELWGALLYGGRVVVVPKATAADPELFHRLLANERITVLNQVPSSFTHLVHHGERRLQLNSLRHIIFGGEALQPEAVVEWWDRTVCPNAICVNMYGITETTVHVTWCKLDRDVLESAPPSATPIGVPLPHLRVSLRAEDSRTPQPGEPGEMWVSGASVASGYLNQPGLTRERFVRQPDTGEVAYRSGDWAVSAPGGGLHYVGRRDRQVKLRGFRIELGEIDAILMRFPTVAVAATTVESSLSGNQILVSYVLSAEGQALDLAALKRHATKLLPVHMRPQRLLRLARLPLGPNGKLDTHALRACLAAD